MADRDAPPRAASDWLLTARRTSEVRADLVLLPYAGIGASLAANLSRFVELPVAMHGVQLPGRENRLSETPVLSIDAVVEALVPRLLPLTSGRLILIGCSFGAIIAWEVAQRLQALGRPVDHLVVLACAAPTLGRFRTELSRLEDGALLATLDQRFGGVPDAVKQNKDLQRLFLPALRGDVTALDHYEWRGGAPLHTPLLTIGGTRDSEVSAEDLRGWRDLVTGPADHVLVEGGHFVLRENPGGVAAILNQRLAGSVG